jgi:hypothetical protein
MIRGIFRLLTALAATVGMLALWLLLIVCVMIGVLYLCRFIPQVGRRGRPTRPPRT